MTGRRGARTWTGLRALAAGALIAVAAAAQPVETAEARDRFTQQTLDAFRKKDYAAAETVLREWVKVEPHNFVPWYDLACALSQQGKTEEGAQMLQRAVVEGFSDLAHMTSDADLARLHETETYKALVAGWDKIIAAQADAGLERVKRQYGKGYRYEKDERLHLVYASAFDQVLLDQSKAEIDRLTRWWVESVTGPVPLPRGGAEGDNLSVITPAAEPAEETDAEAPLVLPSDPWVLVLLPTRVDFAKWVNRRYGGGADRIGGSYVHDDKLLIARDLGASMRHEFWHLLHWRDMDRRSQRHPMWVMEGLCSLVEDVEAGPNGEMIVLPSWRTNMSKRLLRGGRLLDFETLFSLDRKKFMGSKPLAYYAQARSVFVYLAQSGKLRAWYAAYTGSFAEDETGLSALSAAFGKPAVEVEKDYRAWLRDLPEVQEELRPGMATLPFEVEEGEGDGMTIVSLVRGGARAAGLKMRDVVVSINGEPVRDHNDFVRVLGDLEPGMEVEIEYRRNDRHLSARITLIAMTDGILPR